MYFGSPFDLLAAGRMFHSAEIDELQEAMDWATPNVGHVPSPPDHSDPQVTPIFRHRASPEDRLVG
ncbi:hypothetical protein SAMN05444722_2286 [Rhodovulum sp. ES.010]|uniref:hypothetical protein n=1 Tax=Rhodovulum sp. ES.010 TaxID=1882821 RepID=UPI0009289BB0|nr:hypothetical protein [Rhodovulum sp. ES.010]SIO45817.1 hypothetical protein SAMN05444722_2286 [Rhodovulum sp. ES.010]